MLNSLKVMYDKLNLNEYLIQCNLKELEYIYYDLKSSELDKIGIEILGRVLFALENYNTINHDIKSKKIA